MLDLVVITRVIPNRPRLLPIFIKPAIASAIMGGAAWAVYGLLSRVLTAEQVNEVGQTIRVVSRMGTPGHLPGHRRGRGGLSGAGGGHPGHLQGRPGPDAKGDKLARLLRL